MRKNLADKGSTTRRQPGVLNLCKYSTFSPSTTLVGIPTLNLQFEGFLDKRLKTFKLLDQFPGLFV
jgi:hypothetical protein